MNVHELIVALQNIPEEDKNLPVVAWVDSEDAGWATKASVKEDGSYCKGDHPLPRGTRHVEITGRS